jgi:hypothetical protein
VRVAKTTLAFMSVTGVLQILSGDRTVCAKCLDPRNEDRGLKYLAEANRAYEDRAFERALQNYQATYSVCSNGIVFFGIASSELALGHDDDAARDFDRFLREAPDAESELREAAVRRLAELSARLTAVTLAGAAAQATVFVDERAARGWMQGATLYLSPGRHALRVEGGAAGRFERVVLATEGDRVRVEVPANVALTSLPPGKPASHRYWLLWGGVAAAVLAGVVTAYAVTRPDRPPCPTVCP